MAGWQEGPGSKVEGYGLAGRGEGLDRVRREEGPHSCGTMSRMDARPGRVVAAAGRAAESGRLNFGIPGGTESGRAQGVSVCVCVCPGPGDAGASIPPPNWLRRAGPHSAPVW